MRAVKFPPVGTRGSQPPSARFMTYAGESTILRNAAAAALQDIRAAAADLPGRG